MEKKHDIASWILFMEVPSSQWKQYCNDSQECYNVCPYQTSVSNLASYSDIDVAAIFHLH